MSKPSLTGTVYLLHFDRPYKHARHYCGKAASSGVLMVGSAVFGGEFCEPDDPRRAVLDFGSAIRARGLAGSSRWRWLPRRAR